MVYFLSFLLFPFNVSLPNVYIDRFTHCFQREIVRVVRTLFSKISLSVAVGSRSSPWANTLELLELLELVEQTQWANKLQRCSAAVSLGGGNYYLCRIQLNHCLYYIKQSFKRTKGWIVGYQTQLKQCLYYIKKSFKRTLAWIIVELITQLNKCLYYITQSSKRTSEWTVGFLTQLNQCLYYIRKPFKRTLRSLDEGRCSIIATF